MDRNGFDQVRYFLRLSYDGSSFHGWQRQPNGVSVQQVLEEALGMMLRREMRLTGAGRTDTGVHAADFYAHFDLDRKLDAEELLRLPFRLNSYLDCSIAIRGIREVVPEAHARFSAVSRTYKYYIIRRKDPFRSQYAHYVYGDLEVGLMNKAAEMLLEYQDFTSFSKSDTDSYSNICRLTEACWTLDDHLLIFTITANRFLRNMVRAITGTLLEIGKQKRSPEELRGIIESKDRSKAGESAPAKGLILERVIYPPEIFIS